MRKVLMFGLLVAVVAASLAATASASNEPVTLSFTKHVVDPANLVFEGDVSGAIEGGLVSRAVSVNGAGGEVTRFTFDWIVSAGAKSFTARLDGILNAVTGQVVMNGTVISGYLRGAEVHEAGRLVDPATFTFAGTIWIMPATAG